MALSQVAHHLEACFFKASKGEGFLARQMLQSYVMSSQKWHPSPFLCSICLEANLGHTQGEEAILGHEDEKGESWAHLRDYLHIHYFSMSLRDIIL